MINLLSPVLPHPVRTQVLLWGSGWRGWGRQIMSMWGRRVTGEANLRSATSAFSDEGSNSGWITMRATTRSSWGRASLLPDTSCSPARTFKLNPLPLTLEKTVRLKTVIETLLHYWLGCFDGARRQKEFWARSQRKKNLLRINAVSSS